MSDEYEGEFSKKNEINNDGLKQSNNNNENEKEINKDKNDGNNSIDSIEKDLLGSTFRCLPCKELTKRKSLFLLFFRLQIFTISVGENIVLLFCVTVT